MPALASPPAAMLPDAARRAGEHAAARHDAEQLELLAELVRFRTVHVPGTPNWENPAFRAFAAAIERRARAYGLDFTDLGAVLVVGLGESSERLGIVTHGDVQPADATKWQRSPFELDAVSEPGRLVARGAEDDKSAIATALLAMRTLKELELPLTRRIELIISLTEESDWEPFREVLTRWQPPQLNVGIDAQYPVVVAEKGWGITKVTFEAPEDGNAALPVVAALNGGAFISQVPEDASIVITRADTALAMRIRDRIARRNDGVRYVLNTDDSTLTVTAKGKAAHSSTPEHGINAIVHLAALLKDEAFADSAASRALAFINDLLGTGLYGEQFGDIAYRHDFMGPLTVNLSTAKTENDRVTLAINTRAPAGKATAQLEAEVHAAIQDWASARELAAPAVAIEMTPAHYPEQPAHVEPLLAVFRHYTGQHDAKPISIGGGTNARLLPNGVNFGPSMPGVPYSGHSEHEFITREQLTLNLKMYAAMMAWLGTQDR